MVQSARVCRVQLDLPYGPGAPYDGERLGCILVWVVGVPRVRRGTGKTAITAAAFGVPGRLIEGPMPAAEGFDAPRYLWTCPGWRPKVPAVAARG